MKKIKKAAKKVVDKIPYLCPDCGFVTRGKCTRCEARRRSG